MTLTLAVFYRWIWLDPAIRIVGALHKLSHVTIEVEKTAT
jgi:hypothetical protein